MIYAHLVSVVSLYLYIRALLSTQKMRLMGLKINFLFYDVNSLTAFLNKLSCSIIRLMESKEEEDLYIRKNGYTMRRLMKMKQ